MKLFLCVDDEGGMTFMGRRVSRDIAVCSDIVDMAEEKLTVLPFSERLFKDAGYSPRVITSYDNIEDDDCLFIEDISPLDLLQKADTLIIYRWNRLYPSDRKFDLSPTDVGFSLASTLDLKGKSHEKITKEVYTR